MTVTTYAPGVVPDVPPVDCDLEREFAPPQPIKPNTPTMTQSTRALDQFFRKPPKPRKQRIAKVKPPPEKRFPDNEEATALLVLAALSTVSVAVDALVPVMLICEGILHVTGSVALLGVDVTLQERLTEPVKPLDGVAVMVVVLPVVAPGEIEMLPVFDSEKLPAGVWVTLTVAEPEALL